jgi:hypothetical protein
MKMSETTGTDSARLKYLSIIRNTKSPVIEIRVNGSNSLMNDLKEKFCCRFLKKLNSCPRTLQECRITK